MKEKPKWNWDEFLAHVGQCMVIAAFIGIGAAVGGTVWLAQTPEWAPVNAGPNRFFGWGFSAFLFSDVIMTLTLPFIIFPYRWARYGWPIWGTIRYWIFIRSPHTVTAAYYEIEQALVHLEDKDPEQAKLCLTRALTGVAPAYESPNLKEAGLT